MRGASNHHGQETIRSDQVSHMEPGTVESTSPHADGPTLHRWFKRYLDPRKENVLRTMLLVSWLVAAAIDPLLFYIPMIDQSSKCLRMDKRLAITAIILLTFFDGVSMVLWFFNSYKMFQRNKDNAISPRNQLTKFMVEKISTKKKALLNLLKILWILPMPQEMIIVILAREGNRKSSHALLLLRFVVLSQFLSRTWQIYASYHNATKDPHIGLKSHYWSGAALNLVLYLLASHALGAFWYLLSIGRNMQCWKAACLNHTVGCNLDSLYCGSNDFSQDKSFLESHCPLNAATEGSPFNFGIYLTVLQSGVVGSTDLFLKFCYCFSWALRNMSSFGVSLETSAYRWETLFSVVVSLSGLILFVLLIGNMQMFLQSITKEEVKEVIVDKIRAKRELLKANKDFVNLSKELKKDIKWCVTTKWLESKVVMMEKLPEDLRARFDQEQRRSP